MKFMTERIAREGRALNEDVLLVDSFLNHQVDMELMRQCGDAFAEHFRGKGITRVLTVESSGIAPAGMAALALGVSLVFLKKKTSRITAGDVYQTPVQSFTKGTRYELTVASRYLPAGEKVLFIDDFLANGQALLGLADILSQAGAELVGAGIAIEKGFQEGGKKLRAQGVNVQSLATISQMDETGVQFAE